MDSVIILNKEQFQDAIYRAVSRCLDERNIDMMINSSNNEKGFYSRDELCDLLHIAYPTLWRIEREEWFAEEPKGRA